MAEISAPLGIMFFVASVSMILVYRLAIQRKREYSSGKRKYHFLSSKLIHLKEHISSEANRWPIFARPVMFTEIDHNAQVEFAKAQMALTDADQIVPQIETIEEPETPEMFRVTELFRVPTNLRTIHTGNLFSGNVNNLERKVADIHTSVKTIQIDRRQVELKRQKVEKSILDLGKRIQTVNVKLKPPDVWASVENHKISWLINTADSCLTESSSRISKTAESEQGYLEHAIADIFVSIGNFSLDCIELFLESQSVKRGYELDTFTWLFKESTDYLQSILSLDEGWNGWRRLQSAKEHIDKFPEKKHIAETSLRIFKIEQQNLERLIELAKEIKLSDEITRVNELEKECAFYWYSHEERKSVWEKALGSPPKFPSAELNRFQTLLVGDVLPRTEVEIKQSQVMGLIRVLSQALEWHSCIHFLASELKKELRTHKNAQLIVNDLMSSQGNATIMLASVRKVLKDTSPDCGEQGTKLVTEYQSYEARAKTIRGADFPRLKNELEDFIFKSRELSGQHSLLLSKLKSEYTEIKEKMESLLEEINLFINHTPHFENRILNVFISNYDTGRNLLNQPTDVTYSWLRSTTNRMRSWLKNSEPFMAPVRETYSTFNVVKKQARDSMKNANEEIKIQKGLARGKWGWLKNEISPIIDRIENSLLAQKHEWDFLEERKWGELFIHKAIARCANFVKATDDLLNDLNQQIGALHQRQKMLVNKSSDINRVAQVNRRKLSQEDMDEIQSLSRLVKVAETYEIANKILELAQILAMKRANAQDRKEIKKIINIYSDGGPVFMDKMSNTGNIRGRSERG